MNTPRYSPVCTLLSGSGFDLQRVMDMTIVAAVPNATRALETIALTDVSCLPRFGVKGPRAEAALGELGVPVPPDVNTWRALEGGGLAARLGRSEFLLEDGARGTTVPRVEGTLAAGAPGIYPVPRQDLALALVGPMAASLWDQTCSFDLREFDAAPQRAVMTMMVGVSVLVIRADIAGRSGYRVWCDGTFGPYVFKTLLGIAEELGGGVAGICDLYPDALAPVAS